MFSGVLITPRSRRLRRHMPSSTTKGGAVAILVWSRLGHHVLQPAEALGQNPQRLQGILRVGDTGIEPVTSAV